MDEEFASGGYGKKRPRGAVSIEWKCWMDW